MELYSFCALLTVVSGKGVVFFLGDDAGFEANTYGDQSIKTQGLNWISDRGITYTNAFGSVSSCSPSRSSILTGMPSHQNGMYGLHNGYHAFNAFPSVRALPNLLSPNKVFTGMCGKKNIGSNETFLFDFEQSEETGLSVTQIGRNITRMNICVQDFLHQLPKGSDFMLYIAFHDPHRCGHTQPQFGNFCEKFGNKDYNGKYGVIPDWTPQYVNPSDLPSKWSDQPANSQTKAEIAARYTTLSRMDSGIALFLKTIHSSDRLSDSIVIFASDNGPPFLRGRTNLYQFGIRTPLIVSHPSHRGVKSRNGAPRSILDIFPTIMEWFNLPLPEYNLFGRAVEFTGESLLSDFPGRTSAKKLKYIQADQDVAMSRDVKMSRDVFASQSFHEVTMNYVMRAVYSGEMELIQNINHQLPFPIDQDFYISDQFQQVLVEDTDWWSSLQQYYFRSEYELYNMTQGVEKVNLAANPSYGAVLTKLKGKLSEWQWKTKDPWRCAPDGVLQDSGKYKQNPVCMPLRNAPQLL